MYVSQVLIVEGLSTPQAQRIFDAVCRMHGWSLPLGDVYPRINPQCVFEHRTAHVRTSGYFYYESAGEMCYLCYPDERPGYVEGKINVDGTWILEIRGPVDDIACIACAVKKELVDFGH